MHMFEPGFAKLFDAVDRIRRQLETADSELRQYLTEELAQLQKLSDHYIDHWVRLDEQISELIETFDLEPWQPEVIGSVQIQFPDAKEASALTAPAKVQLPVNTGTGPGPYRTLDGHDTQELSASILESAAFDLSDPAKVSFRKGMAYYDLLMYDEAAKSLSQAVEHIDEPVARLYLAAAHANRQRPELARKHLDAVRTSTKDTLLLCAAHEIDAQLDLMDKKVENAVGHLLQIAHAMPDYRDVWFNLGICYTFGREPTAAARAFTRALELNPDDLEAGLLLIASLLHAGEPELAQKTCTLLEDKASFHAEFMLLQSKVALALDQPVESIRLCREILALDPSIPGAWSHLAFLMLKQGHVDEAAAILKKLLTLHPSYTAGQVQLGIALVLSGDDARAERLLVQAMTRYPDKAFLWVALGKISVRRNELQKAYNRFLKGMRDRRKSVKRLALYEYGMTLFADARYQEAEKYLNAALVLGPPSSAILTALGRTAERLGRPQQADRLFASAEKVLNERRTLVQTQ